MRKSRHDDGNTRMGAILRAMDRFTGTTQQERHDDPAPYEDTPAQRAEAAVGLARHLSAGHPGARSLAEALDAEIAAARLEVIFADAICCSECGQKYPDEYWAHVYGDPWEMPELDEFVCDRCLHHESGWVPHMAPEGPDPDDAA